MSVFSASSLSVSDASLARQVKPLPKHRRTSLRWFNVEGRVPVTDPSLTSECYLPINNGRMDRPKQDLDISRTSNKSTSFSARSRIVDAADREGHCTDQLQQPNNTKKRKVPAATTAFAREPTFVRENDDPIDEDFSQDSQVNSPEKMADDAGAKHGLEEFDHQTTACRKPTSLVTMATLRIKARRKTMATAIRDPIDPLALELALSASFVRPPSQPPIRAWSYGQKFRRRPRARVITPSDSKPCFSRKFTFSFPTPTGKRYKIAKKIAVGLQLRLQTELARQPSAASETAFKTMKSSNISSPEKKKINPNSAQAPSIVPSSDKLSKKPTKSKKKKRASLANASNPHHLRNYIPSRVSYTSHQVSSTRGQVNNSLGALALKFLSSTLPPRSKGRVTTGENSGPSLTRPESEWICPFCEYNLFYDDEAAMQRAVRNRRRILARRRNAQERAAAAASGAIASRSQDTSDGEDEDESEDDGDSFGDGSDIALDASLSREAGTIATRQDTKGPHPGG
ncbi:hypothetical protein RSOLAG22IIIB_04283 [Rhizoctonia solani]|uniref:Uncharacterized protein n=1 Tax=Rhizoctonia solani TaxID=456999 RepID=A0A0K6FXH0_9AGAM|nr:hypothetical protein RSOLAG22IIIB_04283 [Rhizoctonia solani]